MEKQQTSTCSTTIEDEFDEEKYFDEIDKKYFPILR